MPRPLVPVFDPPLAAVIRLSLVLKGTACAELQALADRFETDRTETIRRAINRMYWIELHAHQGSEIIMRNPDGSEQTMVFVP